MRAKLKTSCSPAPARSTGFAVDAFGGQVLAQSRLGALREHGQLDSPRAEQVARDRAVAAAVADHGDAPAAGPVRREQRLRDVDEPPRRIHEVDPGGAARGLDRFTAARERAGVGVRGAAPRIRAADGQEHDRLAGGPRRLHERPAVEEVLAVDPDHARPVVLAERRARARWRRGPPGFRSRRHARSRARRPRAAAPTSSRTLPLCETKPIGPAGSGVDASWSSAGAVEEAEAVRTDEHRARGAHPLDERPLARGSLLPELGEARRDRHQRQGARRERVVDRLPRARRRGR